MFAIFIWSWELFRNQVRTALRLGYRHVDTAEKYGVLEEVGAALAASGVRRGDVYLIRSEVNNFE